MVKTIIWKKLTSVLLRGVSTGFWTNAICGIAPATDSGRGFSLCFQSDINMGVGSPRQEKYDFIWHPPSAGSPPLRWTWGCFCNPFLILRLWDLTRAQPDTGQIFLMSDLVINANSQLYVGSMVSAADGVGSPRRNVSTTQALPWPCKLHPRVCRLSQIISPSGLLHSHPPSCWVFPICLLSVLSPRSKLGSEGNATHSPTHDILCVCAHTRTQDCTLGVLVFPLKF